MTKKRQKRQSSNRSLATHFNNMEKDFMRLGDKADKNTSSAVDDLCKTTRIKNIKMGGK